MKAHNIQTLLRKLSCTQIRAGDGWVYSSCPLAPWTHAKSVDNHPSFSVSISDGSSGCRCHACNFKGGLTDLLWRIQSRSGQDMSEAADFVGQFNGFTIDQVIEHSVRERALLDLPVVVPSVFDPEQEVAGIRGVQLSFGMQESSKNLKILPEDTLNRFIKLTDPRASEVRDYLVNERNFSMAVLTKWEVCWDAAHGRITIPVRDCKNRLVGYSGRAHREGVTPKYMHAKGFKRDYYLYGEQFLTEGWTGTGLVMEGFFDAQRLRSYGYAPVAVMGTSISNFQMEKLVRFFNRIVIIPDGDAPGRKAAVTWERDISQRLPCSTLPVEDGADPDDLTRELAFEFLGPPPFPVEV